MGEFNIWTTLITIIVVVGVIQGACAYLVLLERKVAAWVQDRLGPNRVGPKGLLQPIADGIKLLLKEDVAPAYVDKFLYWLAPGIAGLTTLLAFAVVPFGPTDPDSPGYQFVIVPRLDIGILWVFAISSLAVYGVILGGWAANNKYSFLGGLRSSAQLISYEIPLGMSILGVVLFSGSLNLEKIIQQQVGHGWNIFFQPLACLIFLISAFAECNRLPFDLSEAEQELIGGYHTEYSGMKLGLFLLGEYVHMITNSFLLTILFFGGWHFPGITALGGGLGIALKVLVIAGKAFLCIFFFMMVRWTIPRFRFDQLMTYAWKVLLPLALANLVIVMVVKELGWSHWVLLPVSVVLILAIGPLSRPRPVLATRLNGEVGTCCPIQLGHCLRNGTVRSPADSLSKRSELLVNRRSSLPRRPGPTRN